MHEEKTYSFNEMKIQILQLIREEGGLTPSELGEKLFQHYKDPGDLASSYLQRYRRHGLVQSRRGRDDRRVRVYTITERGRKRLLHLQDTQSS